MINLGVTNVPLQNQQLNKYLSRREASLLLGRFSINVLRRQAVKDSCSFTDTNVLDLATEAEVTDSCRLWLFKWTNGRFYPNGKFTRAELVIVIARMLSQDPNKELDSAYSYLLGQKIITVDDRASSSRIAPRYELYLMLSRLTDKTESWFDDTNTDDEDVELSDEVQDIIDKILDGMDE